MTSLRPAWSDDDVEAFRDLARTILENECAPHEHRWSEQKKLGWKPSKDRPRKVSTALRAYAHFATSAAKGAVRVVD